jgi:hypothetical protein
VPTLHDSTCMVGTAREARAFAHLRRYSPFNSSGRGINTVL